MNLQRPVPPEPYSLLPTVGGFMVTSQDLVDGGALPQRHAAAHDDVSPQLAWSGFPPATRGFVVTAFDPDAPTPSGWWHWVIVNLPVSVTSLVRGVGTPGNPLPGGAFHLRCDSGVWGYGGAAPPPGDFPHRYIFAIHALDVPELPLDDSATLGAAAFYTTAHTLARATLTATYQL